MERQLFVECYGENTALWGRLRVEAGSCNFSFCGQCRSHWEVTRHLNKDLIKRQRNAHMCIWRNPRREIAIAKAQRWKRSVHLRQQGRKETGKVCTRQRSDRWTHSNWTHTGHCMNWTWTLSCLSKTDFPTFLTLVSFPYFHSLLSYLVQSASSFPVIARIPPVVAMLLPFLLQSPGRQSTQAVKPYSFTELWFCVEHDAFDPIMFNSTFAITLLGREFLLPLLFRWQKRYIFQMAKGYIFLFMLHNKDL